MKLLAPPKATRIRDSVRALSDRELHQMIVELKFSTRIEQATLAHAMAERRRRTRESKKAAAAK